RLRRARNSKSRMTNRERYAVSATVSGQMNVSFLRLSKPSERYRRRARALSGDASRHHQHGIKRTFSSEVVEERRRDPLSARPCNDIELIEARQRPSQFVAPVRNDDRIADNLLQRPELEDAAGLRVVEKVPDSSPERLRIDGLLRRILAIEPGHHLDHAIL